MKVGAFILSGALALTTLTAVVTAPEAAAAEEPDLTVSDVEFVHTIVDPAYTEGGAVLEEAGDQEQSEAMAEDDAGGIEVEIARVNLDSDNVVVGTTWDPAAVQPDAVSLRYLQDGVWSAWIPQNVAVEITATTSTPTRGGTDPYSLFHASAVEVVVRSEDGAPVPGLALAVIDAEGLDPVDNGLVLEGEDAAEEESVDLSSEEKGDAPGEAEEVSHDGVSQGDNAGAGDDVLLDTEGAFVGETSAASSSAVFSSAVGGIEGVIRAVAGLSSDGTSYDTGMNGLVIKTRKAWGADESKMTWRPKEITIKGAVVHHTEGNNNYTQDQVPGQIRGVYTYHAVTLGWGDIGYNLIVDKYGGVWEGRSGGLTKGIQGAQALGANAETFGITILGTYMTSPPPTVARQAMGKAIAWKLANHGITTATASIRVPGEANVRAGSSNTIVVPTVSAHRDVGWTDCPGDAFYAQMTTVRNEVTTYLKAANGGSGTPSDPSVTPPTTEVPGASDPSFDASLLISDANFFNANAMTETQIKSFIQSAGANCTTGSGKTCLKDATFPTQKLTSLRGGCAPLDLTGRQAPWTIIAKTAQACGISPEVLLVTLQKESSGVAQPLSDESWAKSMGSACPDGQACDPAQAGFAKQIYYGADKLVSYSLNPTWETYVLDSRAGRASTIAHNAETKCGTQTFTIKNDATASLYMYTPYVGASTVSGCATVGAKSFYDIMNRWFPTTVTSLPTLTSPKIAISGVPMVGITLRLGNAGATDFTPAATSVSYQWMRGGAVISGATESSYTLVKADQGKKITVRAIGTKSGYATATALSASVTVKGEVDRLGGSDRYASNLELNRATMKQGAPVFVATGADFADALSIGPAVALQGGALFLTPTKAMKNASLDLLATKQPSKIYVIGGSGAVSDTVIAQLQSVTGVTPIRVGGATRYETSAEILTTFFGNRQIPQAFIATGADFPDALSAAAAGGALKAPVILVKGKAAEGLEASAAATLQANGTRELVVVGGTGVVTPTAVTALSKDVPTAKSVVRLSGSTRFDTNLAVNRFVTTSTGISPTGAWLATGYNFADALSAAAPAGASNQRLVLSTQYCIPKATVAAWRSGEGQTVSQVTLVGQTGVLAESVQNLEGCK